MANIKKTKKAIKRLEARRQNAAVVKDSNLHEAHQKLFTFFTRNGNPSKIIISTSPLSEDRLIYPLPYETKEEIWQPINECVNSIWEYYESIEEYRYINVYLIH